MMETALAIPFLLMLLACGYWGCTHLFLAAAVESVAHAQLLRFGRGQSDLSSALAATVLPGGRGVEMTGKNRSLLQSVLPFSGLAGSTVSSVEASRRGDDIRAFLPLPQHQTSIFREAAVDSWSQDTPSGKKVRRTVQGVLLTGAFR